MRVKNKVRTKHILLKEQERDNNADCFGISGWKITDSIYWYIHQVITLAFLRHIYEQDLSSYNAKKTTKLKGSRLKNENSLAKDTSFEVQN